MAEDPFNLARFVAAQQDSYGAVLSELRAGRKQSHWIWYIFPQLAGLGHSPTAQFYAIRSLDEARAYLAHPVLGTRLSECIGILKRLLPTTSAAAVFGTLDAMKLRSSLTLFIEAGGGPALAHVLEGWFAGTADARTLALLASRLSGGANT